MFLVGNLFIRRFEFFDGTRNFGKNKLYLGMEEKIRELLVGS